MSAEESVELSSNQLGELATRVAEEVTEQSGGPGLESKTPREAVDKYFETRDLKPGTQRTQESSLYNHFVEWCNEVAGIDDMTTLTGDNLANYRIWRRDKASSRVDKLSPKSEETQQKITRTFIEYCESFSAVHQGLHEYVLVPTLDKEDEVRKEILDSETAKEILDYLRKYEYASVQHVVMLLFGASGMRISDLHSLDVGDHITNSDGPYLKIRHRPEKGTTLKNGKEGERTVYVSDAVNEVLEDYIENQRTDKADEYGREPLLTSSHGRLSKSTIRNYVYAWTRPCATGKECPYGRDPEECRGARRNNWASQCPDSLSCHPVRKGYITQELKSGVPVTILSQRCDVSESILEKHYDLRTDEEKMAARRVAMQLAHEKKPGYAE